MRSLLLSASFVALALTGSACADEPVKSIPAPVVDEARTSGTGAPARMPTRVRQAWT